MFRSSVSTLAVAASLVYAGAAHAQSFEDKQWPLQLIGADAAAERGYTGAGVLVGVVDSGIQADHPDLAPNLSDISYDVWTGGPVLDDPDGHGTHVSGIIAAARNGSGVRGVAYDASLALFRLPPAGLTYPQTDALLGAAIQAGVDRGVRIFNNSWGWDFYLGAGIPQNEVLSDLAGQISAFRSVAAADGIMVFATGNEYKEQPSLQSGMPFYVPELESHWLAVTAVGPTGTIASYANHCGLAAEWCLAAPGGEITTGDFADQVTSDGANGGLGGTGLDIKSGTSMATPHVTGAVAIAKQMFPKAHAAELQRIVLATATDIGEQGLDEVYGWGLLNIGNLARTRDAQAASVFANGAWAADRGQSALAFAVDGRLAAGETRGAWASAIGARNDHDATDTSGGASADTFGLGVGYDFVAGPAGLFGVALGWTRTDLDEDGLDNSARIDAVSLAAYGAARHGRMFVEGSAGVSQLDYDFHRGSITGTTGTILEDMGIFGRSSTDGFGVYADARAGLTFTTGLGEVRPFIHAAVNHQDADDFAESQNDADVFAQSVDGFDLTRYEAGPGLQLAFAPRDMGPASVSADLAARYDFTGGDDDYAVPATLLGSDVPGAVGDLGDPFTVSGGVKAAFGARWEASARGFWSTSDDTDAGGVSILVRAVF